MTTPALHPHSAPADASRLMVVDDHPLLRQGIIQLLQRQPDIEVCAEACSAQTALDAMRRHTPDMALVDVSLPGSDGIELIKLMLAEQPRLLILVLSMHDEALYALRALRAGAKGYVMKHQAPDFLIEAIRKVIAGSLFISEALNERLIFKAIQEKGCDLGLPLDTLSDRELEVLLLVGAGKSTREIAGALHLSVKTIETHRAHIKRKLGFKAGHEVVKFAVDWRTLTGG